MSNSHFNNTETKELLKAIVSIENENDCIDFLEDICTIKEIISLGQRLQVAKLLREKKTYIDIEKETGASTATISRINKCLHYGTGGYNKILDKLEK